MNKVSFSQDVIDNQQLIIDKCMGEEDAFCVSSCPMHTDAKQYVSLIAENKLTQAMQVIRETLFLPGTLGRICAHPCETDCRRNTDFGQAISIAGLKRYVADRCDDTSLWDINIASETGKKVVVIGSGPAGAQAAIDLRRKGHLVKILEKEAHYGGMLRYGIPRYRLPHKIIDFEYSLLEKLGIETEFAVEVGKDIIFSNLCKQYDAVVIANGAHNGNKLNLGNSNADGIYSAVEFLKTVAINKQFTNQTGTTSGKKIMIVGGGDVAMDCARIACRIGAEEVYQCSLENIKNLPASKEEITQALEEGVLFNAGFGPVKYIAKDSKITGIEIQEIISIFDANGNFNPRYGNEKRIFEVDFIILAVGQSVIDITSGMLDTRSGGRYVVNNDTLQTNIKNVFVAGNACGSNIVIEAMALGRKAAISIDRFLNEQDLIANRDLSSEYKTTTNLNVPLPKNTVDKPRIHQNLRDANKRKYDFDEVNLGFSDADAIKESSRCLKCECKLCMSECVMMNDFGTCPKNIFEKHKDMPAILAYSCNACDNCTIVCPHELPMHKIFIDSRKDFVKANGGESPIKGHKSIKIHQLLGFSRLFTKKKKGSKNV